MNPVFNKLHHICIVVQDIDKTQAYYESIGIGPWITYPPLTEYAELDVPSPEGFMAMQYRICNLPNIQLQLCQPDHSPSPQRLQLDAKGEGVFHLGFEVPDADAAEAAAGIPVKMKGRRENRTGFTYYDTAEGAGLFCSRGRPTSLAPEPKGTAMKIDLNSDLGEGFGPWTMGDDAAMLDVVTSANIACGGHASDPETMFRTLQQAAARGVVIGAHPGYADRIGFGRRVIPMTPAEVGRMVAAQVGALAGVAALAGAEVRYVKPHGALGNLAADDRAVADAIVASVAALPGRLVVLAISGTELEHAARAAGVQVYSEIFADRAYLPNGRLVPRSQPGAVLHDATEAAERLIRFLETGKMPVIGGAPIALAAQSICVHGDTAGAVDMARIIRERLAAAGVSVKPLL